jgi:protein-disulfide isomerase
MRRRTALFAAAAFGPAAAAAALLPGHAARAQGAAAAGGGERATGRPDAPVRVLEFFSLTCSHCAAFHRETWPRVKRDLVETGTVRMVWRDFPLDRTALMAAMVARSLPPERYEGFIGTLLTNQDRWAFRPNPQEELQRMAALAGMPKAQFDAAVTNGALERAILNDRLEAEREFRVQSTPSFAFQSGGRSRMHAGNMPFDQFLRLAEEIRKG